MAKYNKLHIAILLLDCASVCIIRCNCHSDYDYDCDSDY